MRGSVAAPSGSCRLVRAGDGEPVVVVRTLGAVGRRSGSERTAQRQRGRQVVVVDAHERVSETVHAAVAAISGAGVRADLGRLARPPRIDRRRDARHEPVREPGTAAGIVTAREHVLQVGERQALVDRVRPPDRVHDPVAAREHEPALRSNRRLDRRHRRARVVPACDDALEGADQAVLGRVGQQSTTGAEVDRGGRRLAADAAREQHRGRARAPPRRAPRRPGRGAARRGPPSLYLVLTYLIVNVALPVVWFPAMSVASQRNSVVVVTTNDWPGSRGPVESHNVDVLLGFDPSLV